MGTIEGAGLGPLRSAGLQTLEDLGCSGDELLGGPCKCEEVTSMASACSGLK